LPMAMFQANSLSPDAFTTAMAILVLSSALRVLDRAPGKLPRGVMAEAVVLSVVLGLSKPTYAVVALAYLVPLLDRARRRDSWVLLVPVAAGVLVSTAWQRATASLFVCAVRYFGLRPRPGDQATTILTQSVPGWTPGCSCPRSLSSWSRSRPTAHALADSGTPRSRPRWPSSRSTRSGSPRWRARCADHEISVERPTSRGHTVVARAASPRTSSE
ncbi:MAG: putative rane protein, partial [Actinomycetota bacterium]|nr:putative rane protein [Actinomycetota bacterium]